MRRQLVAIVVVGLVATGARGQDDPAKLEKQRCPKPAEFASVFSLGYGGDTCPKADADFEKMLEKLRAAGFNVIHCTHTDKRLELCRKHGIKMMVDLLDGEAHVYKSPEKAKALCEKLRGSPDVWGYNIWNDAFRKTGEGRKRDVNNVRTWDPTHPAFCGTYRVDGMRHLTNADVMGYYDYHWSRGRDQNFPHLMQYSRWSQERDATFLRWVEVDAGQAGKGNFNRSLNTVNTTIACGGKGVIWFLGGKLIDTKTMQWTAFGQDIAKVNAEVMPLRKEIARFGQPVAVHTTPITKTANNDPLPGDKKSIMPPGLEQNAFPKDFWVRPTAGEFVAGVFRDRDGQDALFLANHNAYTEQEVTLELARPRKAELFSRKTGKREALDGKGNTVSLKLSPAGGEIVRFGK